MSTEQLSPRELTPREQEIFRRDFQDKEREIQKYIGVYLSGLVIVTGWVIGPQSRPVLAMALGNEGYNVYAFLIFLVLNIAFTSFLIYKSLTIHEITQFMTLFATPDSPFLLWDTWRRSPHSATKPVRAIYTIALSVLPVFVSVLLLYGVGNLLFSEPNELVTRLARLEQPALNQISTSPAVQPNADVLRTYITSDQLGHVFATARYWFIFVTALHVIPLYFIYVNILPTYKRWKHIHHKRGSHGLLKDLFKTEATSNPARAVWLYDKETNNRLARLTESQLQFLTDNLEEENSRDRDYYLNKDTLDLLKAVGMDAPLTEILEKAIRGKESIEIQWRDEPSRS